METTAKGDPRKSKPEKETEPVEQIVASVFENALAIKQLMDATRTLLVGKDAMNALSTVAVARRTIATMEGRIEQLIDRHLEDVVINRVS